MLWLHVYLSMLGLAAVLFFSVTGLTLNHPAWFAGYERTDQAQGRVEPAWLAGEDVKKLEIVERLRSDQAVRGALTDFTVDDNECVVTFKGPGYTADAFIDRQTGRYTLGQTSQGWVAILNDLHKGRDAGPVWSWVIDIAAIAMTVIALTGLILLFYLKLRRVAGLVVGVIGLTALVAAWWFGVP